MHWSVASEDQMGLRQIYFTTNPVPQSLHGPPEGIFYCHFHLYLRPFLKVTPPVTTMRLYRLESRFCVSILHARTNVLCA